jgi:hypothetical protein
VSGLANDDIVIIAQAEETQGKPWLLRDLQDPKLSPFCLHEPECRDYPLAALYSEYWGTGDKHLENQGQIIPLPPDVVEDDKLFVFDQYEYITKRVDAFREKYGNTNKRPPGLALIGTPGIGELVHTHIFI